jgi:hypothetical protein
LALERWRPAGVAALYLLTFFDRFRLRNLANNRGTIGVAALKLAISGGSTPSSAAAAEPWRPLRRLAFFARSVRLSFDTRSALRKLG